MKALRRAFAVLFALIALTPIAKAQTDTTHIDATASPYQILWEGKSGQFLRKALGLDKAQKQPLVFLHTDPGPQGFSKYLAWYLARDRDSFSILWCYLNDSGRDFWCWLYRFPTNTLTPMQFRGSYRFSPPAEPTAPTPDPQIRLSVSPLYRGPQFQYRDWTVRSGSLENLPLRHGRTVDKPSASEVIRTIPALNVVPLHEVRVGAQNGWRDHAWTELHSIAYDENRSPYYLIQYDNTKTGFVLDIKNAQTFATDFGSPVVFGKAPQEAPKEPETLEAPEEKGVRRNEIVEITLKSHQKHTAPHLEVLLDADIRTPDGKRLTVPGFWDGKESWKIRFVPNRYGAWFYRTRSNDPELHDQQGAVECVSTEKESKGYLKASGNAAFSQSLTQGGAPFFPIPFPASPNAPHLPAAKYALPATGEPASFLAFQKWADTLAEKGVNRLTEGFLITDPLPRNEGGTPFLNDDIDQINPVFFAWMDRRLAYCAAKGIVPDIGIGRYFPQTVSRFTEPQLRRFWRYVVARYAGYNVLWNLFGSYPGLASEETIAAYATLTRQTDPQAHPITTLVPSAIVHQEANGATNAHTPFADADWLQIITQLGGDLEALKRNVTQGKSMIVQDLAKGSSPEERVKQRRRIWDTFFKGGYWQASSETPIALDAPAIADLLFCSQTLKRTRYWRLAPTPIGKPMTGGETSAVVTPALLLADPGWEYLAYLPEGGSETIDLLEALGTLRVFWIEISTGKISEAATVQGGAYISFKAPDKGEWALHVTRR